MKRHSEVLLPAAPLETAAALLELAMRESAAPVDNLSSALGRMSALLAVPTDDNNYRHKELSRDLAVCIEGLQFHDRLMQQLAQIRDLLAGLAATNTSAPSEETRHWSVLLENLRGRFTSDSHRVLFNLLLPTTGGTISAPGMGQPHANEGSVELF